MDTPFKIICLRPGFTGIPEHREGKRLSGAINEGKLFTLFYIICARGRIP